MEHIQRILFVCTGNTCRSPMAEMMLRQLCEERNVTMEVRSAGAATMDGLPISRHAATVLAERGIDVDHQSSALHSSLVDWADLILTMTESHRRFVVQRFADASAKTFTLKQYVASLQSAGENGTLSYRSDIADPYGGTLADYKQCALEIEGELVKMFTR